MPLPTFTRRKNQFSPRNAFLLCRWRAVIGSLLLSWPLTGSAQVSQEWVKYYRGNELIIDKAISLVTDAEGNVYVIGSSGPAENAFDYTTVKYTSRGEQLWVAHYNGPANGMDQPQSLAVDNAGNVFVTGYSKGSDSDDDYATIKYNFRGEQQWVARYNGPANGIDQAKALAIDSLGNVYVTGASGGSGTGFDYTTIAYNTRGEQQWVARYHGFNHWHDQANALAVDRRGNVYVTGQSFSSTNNDFATLKYNARGEQQWVARYNGPANWSDQAVALRVDAEGNVYVTGASQGRGTFIDYATLKYNARGEQQWIARYSGASARVDQVKALVVDEAGNVYVTGFSTGMVGTDFVTIKYNARGEQLWLVRYAEAPTSYDEATALAVDAGGNVYVTGYSLISGTTTDYITIKYNFRGEQQWIARFNGPANSNDEAMAITVDGAGHLLITGVSWGVGTNYDYVTIKYTSLGEQEWVVRYTGSYGSYKASAMAVDAIGNVYVTGTGRGVDVYSDYVTIKYNAGGELQWVRRYNGPGNRFDEATAIAVDRAGNVYVTGTSDGSDIESDYATIKYNAHGERQWVARYNGPSNKRDYATAIGIDRAGNVYVTGSSHNEGENWDYATLKYNAHGRQQWAARYNGTGNKRDNASALRVDPVGNVYVTGTSDGRDTDSDYATIKYNARGERQWVARYNGPGNKSDYPSDLVIDPLENVYVTGSSMGTSSAIDTDYATIKYNARGERQWVARYNGPGDRNDHAQALRVDRGGNVYVTGSSIGGSRRPEDLVQGLTTVKYNARGAQQWVVGYATNGSGGGRPTEHLALDAEGNIYVTDTGVLDFSRIVFDFITIKYNPSGDKEWDIRLSGPGNWNYLPSALVVDRANQVYVTGLGYGVVGYGLTIVTVKYRQTLAGRD